MDDVRGPGRPDPEEIARRGLRVVEKGRAGFLPWPGVRARLAARDVDAGVGAVVMISGGREPLAFFCLYELGAAGWRSLGAGSMPAQRGFFRGRPSAARSGPACLVAGCGASVSRSQGWPGGDPGAGRPDPGWVAGEVFRVAAEVERVAAGGRTILVPAHGYVVVAWRSSSSFASSSRPVISCLDRTGAILAGLGPGEHVDSGTLAGL
ncbi:MAG: hypothetical protein M3Z75_22230 [Actinomycetota bacterium]|nr:hypothetical protein [Actinomycetota bacterium]